MDFPKFTQVVLVMGFESRSTESRVITLFIVQHLWLLPMMLYLSQNPRDISRVRYTGTLPQGNIFRGTAVPCSPSALLTRQSLALKLVRLIILTIRSEREKGGVSFFSV